VFCVAGSRRRAGRLCSGLGKSNRPGQTALMKAVHSAQARLGEHARAMPRRGSSLTLQPRVFAFALGVFLVAVSASASASNVDPRALVLRATDVPRDYRLDRRQTSVFTNREFGAQPQYAARLDRVSGYIATYHAGNRGLLRSRADVFQRPAGARLLVRDLDAAYGSRGRQAVGVGAGGWVYSSGVWAMVLWRHGRLLGLIETWGLGKKRALAFARLQQSRMGAALR
jgi:hypothetical protein